MLTVPQVNEMKEYILKLKKNGKILINKQYSLPQILKLQKLYFENY